MEKALQELVLKARGDGKAPARGVAALFISESASARAESAKLVAQALGLELYTVDLERVVSKVIGETERNLDRIFADAARSHSVLLFDEADALFGERTRIKDSHDRYANIDVAYLLQRIEAFDGLVILASNLRQKIDTATLQRLAAIIEIPPKRKGA